MPLDPQLVELLACPKCHGALLGVAGPDGCAGPEGFACSSCALFYAVEDGLPNMLVEDAKRWPLGTESETGKS